MRGKILCNLPTVRKLILIIFRIIYLIVSINVIRKSSVNLSKRANPVENVFSNSPIKVFDINICLHPVTSVFYINEIYLNNTNLTGWNWARFIVCKILYFALLQLNGQQILKSWFNKCWRLTMLSTFAFHMFSFFLTFRRSFLITGEF